MGVPVKVFIFNFLSLQQCWCKAKEDINTMIKSKIILNVNF